MIPSKQSNALNIYVAHAINGLKFKVVEEYYVRTIALLQGYGYRVFHPMVGHGILRNEVKFKAVGYEGIPFVSNKAIYTRDTWMIRHSDIMYTNLLHTKKTSTGSVMELAVAKENNVHTVVVMDKNNIHRHAFILEVADVIFENEPAAEAYLKSLIYNNI